MDALVSRFSYPELATDAGAALLAQGVYAAYDGSPVLADVNLQLPEGYLVMVVGPNGAGKSTLFKLLVGILRPTAGELSVFGEAPGRARERSELAYMPQQEQIDWDFPISVWDAVLSARYGRMRAQGGLRRFLPPRLAGARHREAVEAALAAVNMTDLRRRPIGALSGGQKKRVLLARALAQDAQLLLLDEPLTGVDRSSEALIMDVLHRARDEGRTVLMVTHDLGSARQHADLVVLINRTVVGVGAPRDMLTEEMLTRTATVGWASPGRDFGAPLNMSAVAGPSG
jgi:manganese/iron transport system ATP-binding protein